MKSFSVVKVIKDDKVKGDGVVFNSGLVVVEWSGKIQSLVMYKSLADFELISGITEPIDFNDEEKKFLVNL